VSRTLITRRGEVPQDVRKGSVYGIVQGGEEALPLLTILYTVILESRAKGTLDHNNIKQSRRVSILSLNCFFNMKKTGKLSKFTVTSKKLGKDKML